MNYEKPKLEYNKSQVALLKRFIDNYQQSPVSSVLTEGFLSFQLNEQEKSDLEIFIENGLVDVKDTAAISNSTSYRLSEKSAPILKELKKEGKVQFK